MTSKRKKIIGLAVILVILLGATIYGSQALANTFFAKGNYYFNGGAYNLAKAERFYKLSTTLNPKLSNAHYQLARVYFIENKLDLAKAEIDKEVLINPSNFKAFYTKGLIGLYNDDLGMAVENFKKVLAVKPQSWAALNDLSVAYLKSGNYNEAKLALTSGVNQFPDNAWLKMNLGTAEMNLGKSAEATKYFNDAKNEFSSMNLSRWENAYPGDDLSLVNKGREETLKALESNLALLENKGTNLPINSKFVLASKDKGYAIAACGESIGISANPKVIGPSGASTLTWTTAGVNNCSINNGIGAVAANGTKVVRPTVTTTYMITCTSIDHGASWSDQAMVTVSKIIETNPQ